MTVLTPLDELPQPRRLCVLRRDPIDTEGPYSAERHDDWTFGSLALESPRTAPLRFPGSGPPLRLVTETADVRPDTTDDAPVAADAEAPAVSFAAVRTPRAELPALGPHATTLVRALLEVLAGDRPLRQLARCTSPAVYDELEVLVSPTAPRPWAGTLRRVLLSEPLPGIAEVTAVVVHGARTVAMALRFEGVDGRWQLTALQLV